MSNIPLSYVFIIFFLTLGPIKTIPVFFSLTKEASTKFRKKTALQATLISIGICLFISIIGRNVLGKWGVSLDALRLAGGLILLLSALKIVTMQPQPSNSQIKITADSPLALSAKLAISPLSTPVIITPYGVVAILFYMVIAKGNLILEMQLLAMIFLMMLLNLLGMLFADKIMSIIGMPILRLIGWIFAVMQSALAIDIMLNAFQSLGIIKSIN